MDYLLSLIGKDEATIVDAIKDLAANSEKVKAQEIEIKELFNKIDDNKEEVHFLKNKLDQKFDFIEDLENDLEHVEIKLKEAQKKFELKEKEFNQLKMLITDQVEEINILRDNNQSMIGQIAENIQMENKIKYQDELIKDLNENLSSETASWKKENCDVEQQNTKLQKEIKEIERMNAEKAKELKKLETENKELEIKMVVLELGILESRKSLAEEIKDVEKNCFMCEECANTFESKSDLKFHMRNMHELVLLKLRLLEIETHNSKLKHKLYSDLFRIKELEMKGRDSCSCRGFCAITHSKHNWTKSLCDELLGKMEKSNSAGVSVDMHQCKTCEQMFSCPMDFIHHMQNNHKTADVNFLQNLKLESFWWK